MNTSKATVMVASLAIAGAALVTAPTASADYDAGCERVRWGFLASGYRTICDGPRLPDGSWNRVRREWTPAHTTSGYCSGYYYISCSSPRYYEESTQSLLTYPVNDGNIVPGEPAWIPPGTVRILS